MGILSLQTYLVLQIWRICSCQELKPHPQGQPDCWAQLPVPELPQVPLLLHSTPSETPASVSSQPGLRQLRGEGNLQADPMVTTPPTLPSNEGNWISPALPYL